MMTDIATSFTAPEGPHAEFSLPYQYSSLEKKPRTIRLLRIYHKCSLRRSIWHDQDERVQCGKPCCQGFNASTPRLKLREISLDTDPAYEAISYAWGSGDLVEQVACGSGVLRVTQSCYDLLCTLRERDDYNCTATGCRARARLYWIDAICIDQGFQLGSSQQERSHQVAMMATIYEKADRVLVWPGQVIDAEGINYALDTTLVSVREEDIPQLRNLIQQPYFTRIWPLQEVSFAQCCRIFTGPESGDIDINSVFLIPRWPFVNIAQGRIYKELAAVRHQYEQVTSLHKRLLVFFQSQSNDSDAAPGQSTPPSISEVLLGARNLQASEPRDKVFALYGVLQRLGARLEAPDYQRSVGDVYVEASVEAIHTDRSLRILEGVTGSSSFDLPSWSPDWSDHQYITEVADWTSYKASGSSEVKPDCQGQKLRAYSRFIDVVRQEHIDFPATSFLDSGNTLGDELVKPLRSPGSIPVDQYLDLLERLFLDVWESGQKLPVLESIYLFQMQRKVKWVGERMVSRIIGFRKNKEFTTGFLKTISLLHAGLCRRLDRKKLFQTQHGRMGIASRNIKSGDSIILLQGCNLPMVVRPESENWTLIAPAYLPEDGVMDGKLWEMDDSVKLLVFT